MEPTTERHKIVAQFGQPLFGIVLWLWLFITGWLCCGWVCVCQNLYLPIPATQVYNQVYFQNKSLFLNILYFFGWPVGWPGCDWRFAHQPSTVKLGLSFVAELVNKCIVKCKTPYDSSSLSYTTGESLLVTFSYAWHSFIYLYECNDVLLIISRFGDFKFSQTSSLSN